MLVDASRAGELLQRIASLAGELLQRIASLVGDLLHRNASFIDTLLPAFDSTRSELADALQADAPDDNNKVY